MCRTTYYSGWLLQTWSSVSLKCDKIPEKLENINLPGKDSNPGFQEAQAPRFQDSRHKKGVRLSALRTGRLRNIPGTQFYWGGWVDPRAIVRPEGLCPWKIPMTPATFPACSVVRQPTAQQRAPLLLCSYYYHHNHQQRKQKHNYCCKQSEKLRKVKILCEIHRFILSTTKPT